MRVSRHHLGIGFEVWNAQQSWFWFVENTNRNGTIGAAATESDAIADAHSSIEEISNSDCAPRTGNARSASSRDISLRSATPYRCKEHSYDHHHCLRLGS